MPAQRECPSPPSFPFLASPPYTSHSFTIIMTTVRNTAKQGAPFSAWEAMDTLFEQAFTLCSTLSPLVTSHEYVDHLQNMSRPFIRHDSHHKSFMLPHHKASRRDSLSSTASSLTSEASFEYEQPTQAPKFIATNHTGTTRLPKPFKAAKGVSAAPIQPASTPQPTAKPRVSRVRYSEGSSGTRSAIFSLPRVVDGDVHVGFTPGQLEISWEYTKTRKVVEDGQVVVRQKPKKFTKTLPLPESTTFSQIRANLTGRQLTLTYPK